MPNHDEEIARGRIGWAPPRAHEYEAYRRTYRERGLVNEDDEINVSVGYESLRLSVDADDDGEPPRGKKAWMAGPAVDLAEQR